MSREGRRVEKERVEKECELRRNANLGVRVEKECELRRSASREGDSREGVRVEKECEKRKRE